MLNTVFWALGQKKFERFEDFIAEVTEYNNEIAPGKHGWDPNLVIAPNSITVLYEAGWKDEDDMLELKIGNPNDPLSMGTFLFTLNNDSYEFFQDTDEHFFEGLSLHKDSTFWLNLGS